MSQANDKDFKRRFPRGLGEPIVRHKCRLGGGEVLTVHEGGPVDLKDPDIIATEVADQLRIQPYSSATPEEVCYRATNNVRGIIYKGDKTYRYFIWLTVARTYQRLPADGSIYGENGDEGGSGGGGVGDVISGPSGPFKENGGERGKESGGGEDVELWTKIVKVPFLVWMGSSYSFLSFDVVDIFFSGPEFEYSRFQLSVDGAPFLFHAPDDNSNFNHYNVLGRDFMESRFNAFEADYSSLSVFMRRRKHLLLVPGQPLCFLDDESGKHRTDGQDRNGGGSGGGGGSSSEGPGSAGQREDWVRQRDEDLERFLEEDEEGDSDGDMDEENVEGFKKAEARIEASIDPRLLEWDSRHGQMEQERVEGSVDNDAREAQPTEAPGEGVASTILNRSQKAEGSSENDAEGDVKMMENGGSQSVIMERHVGLRERRIVEGEADSETSPASAPISRKEGKRSGIVSKENLRVSGGRTGSGMRR
ncbi:hypothetical protein TWF718_003124 [Orbilia javanica]|uniref:Uncharacterized protein n=1 Tax=Orbilia javanica TaxID=47235 RepID=A0AAN8NLG0_9PEZI